MIDLRFIKYRNRILTLCPFLIRLSEYRHLAMAARTWRQNGWTVPVPFFVRRAMLISEAKAIGADTLIETGTFLGDTTWSLRDKFRKIHTVEVAPKLAELARDRFKDTPSIELHEGDSATLLAAICASIKSPAVLYLDGHYSGGETGMGDKECPVIEELTAIFTNLSHPFRIIIDDARLFGEHAAYPAVRQIEEFLQTHTPIMKLRQENDAIVIY